MDMQVRIHSFSQSLTRTESTVAQYILQHIESVLYMSITELADVVGVSETTVVRFCRKIGFSGYQEFRLNVAKDQPSKDETADPDLSQQFIQVLQEGISSLSIDDVITAAKMINAADSIYIYGVGSSGITAMDFENRLQRMGKRANAITDWHMQTVTSAGANARDIIVAISVSGSTSNLVETLNIAKANQTPILLITNYFKSSISKIADVALVVAVKEMPPEGGWFGPKTAQLMCMDLICKKMEHLDDKTRMKRINIAEIVSKKL